VRATRPNFRHCHASCNPHKAIALFATLGLFLDARHRLRSAVPLIRAVVRRRSCTPTRRCDRLGMSWLAMTARCVTTLPLARQQWRAERATFVSDVTGAPQLAERQLCSGGTRDTGIRFASWLIANVGRYWNGDNMTSPKAIRLCRSFRVRSPHVRPTLCGAHEHELRAKL